MYFKKSVQHFKRKFLLSPHNCFLPSKRPLSLSLLTNNSDNYKVLSNILFSVSDPYWSQYGSWSSILGQYGYGFRICIQIQVFSRQKWEKIYFAFISLSSSQNCFKCLVQGLLGSRESHRDFSKIVEALFNTKSLFFFLFGRHFYCPGSGSWFRIRNMDPDLGKPFQCETLPSQYLPTTVERIK